MGDTGVETFGNLLQSADGKVELASFNTANLFSMIFHENSELNLRQVLLFAKMAYAFADLF